MNNRINILYALSALCMLPYLLTFGTKGRRGYNLCFCVEGYPGYSRGLRPAIIVAPPRGARFLPPLLSHHLRPGPTVTAVRGGGPKKVHFRVAHSLVIQLQTSAPAAS